MAPPGSHPPKIPDQAIVYEDFLSPRGSEHSWGTRSYSEGSAIAYFGEPVSVNKGFFVLFAFMYRVTMAPRNFIDFSR
jgi:hypothetical protein